MPGRAKQRHIGSCRMADGLCVRKRSKINVKCNALTLYQDHIPYIGAYGVVVWGRGQECPATPESPPAARSSKSFRPTSCAVIDAQDLDCVTVKSVRHDEWRSRDHEFSRTRHASWSAHFGVVGQERFNVVDDVKGDALRGGRVILLNIGTKRSEVLDRFGRP